ncbi:hypothetical protein SLE2022_254370 [Rubroshorea leprosula]
MDFIIEAALGSAGEQIDCHRNFPNDVDDLREIVANLKRRKNDKEAELLTVDYSKKRVKEEVQGWLKDARRVIEIEMPDIEEEVQNVSYLSRGSLGRHVRQKIQEVREMYDRGGFPEGLVIEKPPPSGITLPIENMVGEVNVKEQIWGYLGDIEVGIIGVCGIGGVGKTTVMKHVHNELLNKPIGFTKIIWVTVSQSLSVVKLQDDIARKMNRSLPKDGDELERASRLMEIMKTEKFALILDDVWDTFRLHEVGIPEPTIENGCKIVITSRLVDVCNHLRCQIVMVPLLPKQESLNLFLDTVGRDILRIPNLEKILKDMVVECAGLPLAIVVIAGSMRGVTDIHEWRSALRQLCNCVVGTERDSEDRIFKRLKFSYDRLPNSSIQECFSYCSLYPEDCQIEREDLIEAWICEGLIEKLESRRAMHDEGHAILNRLLKNCLLQGYVFQGEYVAMHDVVRDMALRVKSTGRGRFMVKAQMRLTEIPDEDEWIEDLDKVSLMGNQISDIPINISPKCLMLSTLILENNPALRQIPECFLENMPKLKFLNLSDTDIEALPNSICSLKNLTALILCGCTRLKCMPSLSKLKALEKLDLLRAGLHVAPEGIEMLGNLKYLDLSCPNLKVLPGGKISELVRLQYLRIFTTDTRAEDVARLKKLEYFECRFDWLKEFNSYVSKVNHFGRRPRNYCLEVGAWAECGEGEAWKFHDSDIKEVTLDGCKIGENDVLVLPDDLLDLRIFGCNTVADISIFLKNLTQLQTYELTDCEGIECVVSLSSSSSSSLTVMNNLASLSLGELHSLRHVVKVEKTTTLLAATISPHIFPNLKDLSIWDCSKLKKLFPCELLQGQSLQNLEKIHVQRCSRMEEIIGWEEEEEGNQTTTPILIALPKLRILELKLLPELRRLYPERGQMVFEALHIFSNLEDLKVCDCSKLKKLFPCELLQGQSLQNLEKIHVQQCSRMEEIIGWEEEEEGNQTTTPILITLPKLRILELKLLPELRRIYPERGKMVFEAFHIFSNLKDLRVCDCSKLKKLFPCELLQGQRLQNLEEILVEGCNEMEEIIGWEEEEAGNQTTTPILITLPKLRILQLRFLPELKRICPERGVMICDSLNSIFINVCDEVKRIPLCLGRENGQPSLPVIKDINIQNPKEWWESVEWENPDDKNVLLPFLKHLT